MRALLPLASLLLALAATPGAIANVATVNSTADPGNGVCDAAQCTLREALASFNDPESFSDTVKFAIPGNGPHVIALSSVLPIITREIHIDGFSQPGATSPNLNTGFSFVPAIELDGSLIPDGGQVYGLRFAPVNFSSPDVKGVAFTNFQRPPGDAAAIWLDGPAINLGGSLVESNFIGLSASGTQARPNDIGVFVTASKDARILGNVIAGNRVGVLGNGRGDFRGVNIGGNRIGTNPAGTAAVPNTEDGIRIVSGCATPARTFSIGDNLIAGNGRDGIHLIGETGACNLLSGGAPSITANRIGISLTGAALGNGRHGIGVGLNATTRSLTIGSPMDSDFEEDQNTIAFNGGAGVAVFTGGTGILIRQNTFRSNVGLPIDLGANGSTPNDPDDADTGPNRLLNTPVLGPAQRTSFEATLSYSVPIAATNARFPLRVDFYARLPNGTLQFIDTDEYVIPNAVKSITVPIAASAALLAMTSDDANGESQQRASNSSEFSAQAQAALFVDGFE